MMLCLTIIATTLLTQVSSTSAISCCNILYSAENPENGQYFAKSQALAEDLIRCVNSSSSLVKDIIDDAIVYTMFASPEVFTYASHTTLANGAFFEHSGHAARLLSHETGDDFYPKDRRWNKIRAIVRAFSNDGWAQKTQALVSIDTDLLILDWSLDAGQILDAHPEADLIMSADALDVGNTGFLIVRNTKWALSFFQEWWDSRHMKHTFCDQHVLNKLITGLRTKELSHKVHVLPNNAVNSRWPALETMDETDRVLHLMGETTPFRAAVARHASHSLCEAAQRYSAEENKGRQGMYVIDDLELLFKKYLPFQYGFSQKTLVLLARQALSKEREERYAGAASAFASEKDFESLHAANSNSCDDKRKYLSSNHSECEQYFHEEYLLVKQALDSASDRNRNRNRNSGGVSSSLEQVAIEDALVFNMTSDYKLFLLDHMAKTLYDMVFFAPADRKRASAEKVQLALEGMREQVDMTNPVNQIYLDHKTALIHAQLSSYYFSEQQWESSLQDSVVAINALGRVLEKCQESNPDFPGYVLEYISCASRTAETFLRLQRYEESLEWAKTALRNAEVLYSTYRGEERVIAQDLARLHAIVAEAYIHHPIENHLQLASDELALAKMSKLTFDVENELPRALKDRLVKLHAIVQAKKREEQLK